MKTRLRKPLAWLLAVSLLLTAAGAWAGDETAPVTVSGGEAKTVDGSIKVTVAADGAVTAAAVEAETGDAELTVEGEISLDRTAGKANGAEPADTAAEVTAENGNTASLTVKEEIRAESVGDEAAERAVEVSAQDGSTAKVTAGDVTAKTAGNEASATGAEVYANSGDASLTAQEVSAATTGGDSMARGVDAFSFDGAATVDTASVTAKSEGDDSPAGGVYLTSGGEGGMTFSSGSVSAETAGERSNAVAVTARGDGEITVTAENVTAGASGDGSTARGISASANTGGTVTVTADAVTAKAEGDRLPASGPGMPTSYGDTIAVSAWGDGEEASATVQAGEIRAETEGEYARTYGVQADAQDGGAAEVTAQSVAAESEGGFGYTYGASVQSWEGGKASLTVEETISAQSEGDYNHASGVTLQRETEIGGNGGENLVEAKGITATTTGDGANATGLEIQYREGSQTTVRIGEDGISARTEGQFVTKYIPAGFTERSGFATGVDAEIAPDAVVNIEVQGDVTATSTDPGYGRATALQGQIFEGGSLTVHVGGGVTASVEQDGASRGLDLELQGGTAKVTVDGAATGDTTGVAVSSRKRQQTDGLSSAEEKKLMDELDQASVTYTTTVSGVKYVTYRRIITEGENAGEYEFSVRESGSTRTLRYGTKTTYRDAAAGAEVQVGSVAVDAGNTEAYGMTVSSSNALSDITVTANGDVSVTSEGEAQAVLIQTTDGKVHVKTGGDVSALAEGHTAVGVQAYAMGAGQMDAEIGGKITAEGESVDGHGIIVGVSAGAQTAESRVTVTVADDITVRDLGDQVTAVAVQVSTDADEDGNAGDANVVVDGNLTSNGDGISMNAQSSVFLDGTATVKEEEYVRTRYFIPDGVPTPYAEKIYYNAEGDYYYNEYGTMWREVDPGSGSARAEIRGDVTADEAGVSVYGNGITDVIIDGTLEGKGSAVLLQEETTGENFTLTVWEIRPDAENNLFERARTDENGEEIITSGEAEQALEKEIQYIIRLQPSEGATLYTEGTYDYEGYTVAKEGDTVILKVRLKDGYELLDAYNGTDTKVQLLRDANGEYYLVVPRGGAVLLSVRLRKNETPAATRNIPYVPATVTIDPNGGLLRGSAAPFTIAAAEGKWIDLPEAPTLEGKTFLGWYGTESPRTDSRWTAPEKDSPALKAAGARVMIPASIFYTAIWE